MKKIRTILDLEDGDRFFVEKGGHKLMKIRQINTAAKGNAVDLVTGKVVEVSEKDLISPDGILANSSPVVEKNGKLLRLGVQ